MSGIRDRMGKRVDEVIDKACVTLPAKTAQRFSACVDSSCGKTDMTSVGVVGSDGLSNAQTSADQDERIRLRRKLAAHEGITIDADGSSVSESEDSALLLRQIYGALLADRSANMSFNSTLVSAAPLKVIETNNKRKYFSLQNLGAVSVYLGASPSVTSLNGVMIAASGYYTDQNYTGDVYLVTASGSCDVRWQEVY